MVNGNYCFAFFRNSQCGYQFEHVWRKDSCPVWCPIHLLGTTRLLPRLQHPRQLAPAEEQYLGSTAVFFACYRRDLRLGRLEDDRFWRSNTHSLCKRTGRIRRLPLGSLSNDKLRRKTNITYRLQSCALVIKPLQESPRHFNQNWSSLFFNLFGSLPFKELPGMSSDKYDGPYARDAIVVMFDLALDASLRRGGGLQKKFFRPFGPHFGLKIRGGASPPGPSPGSATAMWWILHGWNNNP